jgi:hypothetical protein
VYFLIFGFFQFFFTNFFNSITQNKRKGGEQESKLVLEGSVSPALRRGVLSSFQNKMFQMDANEICQYSSADILLSSPQVVIIKSIHRNLFCFTD